MSTDQANDFILDVLYYLEIDAPIEYTFEQLQMDYGLSKLQTLEYYQDVIERLH